MIYKICTHCIMDTSDPRIQFDDQGVCEYCNNFKTTIAPSWNTGAQGAAALARMAEQIKADTQGKDFDAIIGLSGGLDSSYAAYVAVKKMGLRPLLFHVDAGWNTDQAVGNIEKLVDGLGVDLYTEVINWEEMKDLQVADNNGPTHVECRTFGDVLVSEADTVPILAEVVHLFRSAGFWQGEANH